MSDESTHHRVVILYSSIGAGHRIAAEALASAVRTAAPEIAIKTGDAIEIVGSRIALRVPGFYPWFRGRFPWLYDRLWRSKRTAGAFSWLGGRLGGRARRAVQEFLAEAQADAVVTTHGWASGLAASARRAGVVKCHLAIPTDFGMHPYWSLEDIDEYVVSTRQMRDALVLEGFPPERIHVLGIPIRTAFADDVISGTDSEVSVPEIQEDMPTVLMIAGASGTGYYERAFAEIRGLLEGTSGDGVPFRVVVVTGSEGPAKAVLQEAAEHFPWPAEVLGLVENMHEIMAGADLLVAKPGGLIVSEALAKGLPMALIGPSAGQERANTELLLEEAVAVEVTKPGSLCRQIRQVIDPPHRLVAMAERARTLGHPNSAMDCASLVKRLVTGQ